MEQNGKLIEPMFDEEIVNALKSIGDNKAPGLDEFNAKFFKSTESIVSEDMKKAVRYSFENKRSFPALNCTPVAFIPETSNARSVREMTPIS